MPPEYEAIAPPLLGFDDIDAAAWTSPPLTTIAVDKQQLGRQAVMLLLAEAQEGNTLLPVSLVARASA
jgi:LacI family repressor for deo operon, udp, cdd, tsx, nupC, and nupG